MGEKYPLKRTDRCYESPSGATRVIFECDPPLSVQAVRVATRAAREHGGVIVGEEIKTISLSREEAEWLRGLLNTLTTVDGD